MSKARGLADLGNVYGDGALSNRNLIINGAMQVAQRGTTKSSTFSNYLVDRFRNNTTMTTYTYSQSTDAPSGFSNSSKVEVTTAEVAGASDFMFFSQHLEGQNLQRLAKGTASAQSVTVSFWVKSNVTGTYILEFDDNDNSRNINKAYTVDVSGTWEYKTITFEGDTSGAFDNDNELSGLLRWFLDAGTDFTTGTLANSWEATSNVNRAVGITGTFGDAIGNYWQITGVQLEVGDTATPFEHRSYGEEMAKCQRYLYRLNGNSADQTLIGMGYFYGTTTTRHIVQYPVTMRSSPSVSANGLEMLRDTGSDTAVTISSSLDESIHSCGLNITDVASTTIGEGCILRLSSSTSSYISFDAEL
jgi:hypothetical protein